MAVTRGQAKLSAPPPGFFGRHANVYLYVPNLIGYLRVAAALYAFAVALRDPTRCAQAYMLSFVCDELDGRFARRYNQCSTLGAVLDMVTDRVATCCLLALLCVLYPWGVLPLLALLQLDIASHWFQMYATLAQGASTHKDTGSRSALVRAYYRHRLFMGFCCVSCEALYLTLYLLAWPAPREWGPSLTLPAALAPLLNGHTPDAGVPALAVFAAICVPGWAIKQWVNVVQLRAAAAQLVTLDLRRDAAATLAAGGGSGANGAAPPPPPGKAKQ